MGSAYDLSHFRLDRAQLADVAGALEHRIREGLAFDGKEIKALPAYLEPPAVGLQGEAVVVDAGGSNVRAAHVRLGGEGDQVLAGPAGGPLPVRGEDAMSAYDFWHMQAEFVERCRPPAGLPLGYCFSYPSRVHDDRDATLITWTKGVAIEGVEGQRVGAPLYQALHERGVNPTHTVVLNDTVAALLGGSAMAPDPARVIGLIAGTGTNMAAYFSPRAAPKLQGKTENLMAVNLESGNFKPPFLNEIDDAFDAETDKPGQQRFEKAMGGYALPYLFQRLVAPEHQFDPTEGGQRLTVLTEQGSGRPREVAEALLERSADLVAAGLYGVARVLGDTAPIHVLAEGSLMWKSVGYAARVQQTLEGLAPNGPRFELIHRPDVNLFGSAAAALSV